MHEPYTNSTQSRLTGQMRSSAIGSVNAASPNPDLGSPMQIYGYLALCILVIGTVWLFPRGPNLIIATNPFSQTNTVMDVVSSADSYFVAGARYPWSASVYSSEPNFTWRLFSAGALLVIRDYAPMSCFQEQSQ
jgi:hypothetical protein